MSSISQSTLFPRFTLFAGPLITAGKSIPIANNEDFQLAMKTLRMFADSPSILNAAVSAATILEHSPSGIYSVCIAFQNRLQALKFSNISLSLVFVVNRGA